MTPALQQFHEQHKQRLARINERAWRPPVIAEVVEVVSQPIDEPPVEEKINWKVVTITEESISRGYVPSARDIQNAICEFFGVSRNDLLSSRRAQPFVSYRQLGFLLAKELTRLSIIRIGIYFGGKDHTTVLYGARKAKSLIQTNDNLRAGYEAIKIRFGGADATP